MWIEICFWFCGELFKADKFSLLETTKITKQKITKKIWIIGNNILLNSKFKNERKIINIIDLKKTFSLKTAIIENE